MRYFSTILVPWLCFSALGATAEIERRQTAASTTLATQSVTSTGATTTSIPFSSPTGAPAATTSAPATTDGGSDYTSGTGIDGAGSQVDSNAGASGSTGGFTLSKGGLIAICVVVGVVIIFGIVSTVLFVLAKRRQWNIRQSIRRASRRLTGRGAGGADRQSKRAGLQMSAMPARRGHKRGVRIEVADAEKGDTATPMKDDSKWSERLWRNDWKR